MSATLILDSVCTMLIAIETLSGVQLCCKILA